MVNERWEWSANAIRCDAVRCDEMQYDTAQSDLMLHASRSHKSEVWKSNGRNETAPYLFKISPSLVDTVLMSARCDAPVLFLVIAVFSPSCSTDGRKCYERKSPSWSALTAETFVGKRLDLNKHRSSGCLPSKVLRFLGWMTLNSDLLLRTAGWMNGTVCAASSSDAIRMETKKA